MKIQVYILNSFITNNTGGNPAGVVLNSDYLSSQQMQLIANKVNLSETAYIQKVTETQFKVRFFTPLKEVDFCGHATLAVFYLMFNKLILSKGEYEEITKAGTLSIEIKDNGLVFMDQTLPIFSNILSKDIIADCLNIPPNSFVNNVPVQVVSTGFPTICVPIKNLTLLQNIKPNLDKCRKLCKGTLLLHLFSLETINVEAAAFSRNFFPIESLDEESATGSSTGALACYLYKHKLIRNSKEVFIFEQGHFMNRPSTIYAKISTKEDLINGIKVGGYTKKQKESVVQLL